MPKVHQVPAREGCAVRLLAGEYIKLINTHGTQVIDMWAFNADDPLEIMSMHHTKSMLRRMMPRIGEAFFTYKRRPILTLVEDHSPGIHETVLPACDKYRYLADGFEGYHASCGDNLMKALGKIEFPAPPVTPQPFQVWMNCPIGPNGEIDYLPPATKPGDYTVFRAEMECVIVLSACPYDLDDRNMPVNGPEGQPKDVHYEVW